MDDAADEESVEETLQQLIQWGLVEDRDGDIQPTRKWVAKLQATAEKLNQIVQNNGGMPLQGNPLVIAVQQALANENLTLDEDLFRRSVQLLVVLELSRMGPDKRGQYGFGGVAF